MQAGPPRRPRRAGSSCRATTSGDPGGLPATPTPGRAARRRRRRSGRRVTAANAANGPEVGCQVPTQCRALRARSTSQKAAVLPAERRGRRRPAFAARRRRASPTRPARGRGSARSGRAPRGCPRSWPAGRRSQVSCHLSAKRSDYTTAIRRYYAARRSSPEEAPAWPAPHRSPGTRSWSSTTTARFRHVLATLLQKAGYAVDQAGDGADALARIERRRVRPRAARHRAAGHERPRSAGRTCGAARWRRRSWS